MSTFILNDSTEPRQPRTINIDLFACSTSVQRCHSEKMKTLDGPLKKPQKTLGQISMQLAYIFAKIPTFPGKNPTFRKKFKLFRRKSVFSPQKFLMNFLVINSDFLIFYLLSLIDQKLRKQQVIPYFFS